VRFMIGITSPEQFDSWGWRIPFLASVILIGIGLWIRLGVSESPTFKKIQTAGTVSERPVLDAISKYWKEILLIAFIRMAEQAPFYLFITFVLSYGTHTLGLDQGNLLDYTLVAATLSLFSIPFFGWLSDRIGRRKVYAAGIIVTGLIAFPYYAMLDSKSAGLVLVAIVVSLIGHDMQYGPQAALIAESFEPEVRYSAAGLGYQLASIVAGGPAPLIATALLVYFGSSSAIAAYIVICAVISLIALWLLPHRLATDHAEPALAEPTTPTPPAADSGSARSS
ncbi:MAG: MFS transporter, partial [Nakamurella sp.]